MKKRKRVGNVIEWMTSRAFNLCDVFDSLLMLPSRRVFSVEFCPLCSSETTLCCSLLRVSVVYHDGRGSRTRGALIRKLAFYVLQGLFLFQRIMGIHISSREHEIEGFSFTLIFRCSLKPKNHLMEYFLCLASPSKVLWINMNWFWHTNNEVESMKLILVSVSSKIFLIKTVSCNRTSFSSSTKRL